MPYLSGKGEAGIVVGQGEADEYTDPEFPPTSASLFMDPGHPPATAPAGADWSRVHGHLYVPDKKLVSILPVRYLAACNRVFHDDQRVLRLSASTLVYRLQGALRDRWLLGAIACVGCRPDLLLDLFVSDELSHKGLYTFQFYKHGCWHQVVIDSYLPCVLGHEEVLFACSGTPGVMRAGCSPASSCALYHYEVVQFRLCNSAPCGEC